MLYVNYTSFFFFFLKKGQLEELKVRLSKTSGLVTDKILIPFDK